jgi:hypothetical protein
MINQSKVDQIAKWRKETEEVLRQYKEELATLQHSILEAEERIKLFDRLLILEGHSFNESTIKSDTPESFLDACINVIRENGKPIHITDLHSELLKSGIPIPGKGDQANVIARIQRSDGIIIRTGRGMYGLPEFGEPEKKPIRRKKKSTSKSVYK